MPTLLVIVLAQLPCGNGQLDHGSQPVCAPCIPGGSCPCSQAEVAEECDGVLVPTTCAALGYQGGVLKCDAQCHLDPSACQSASPALTTKSLKLAPAVERARVVAGERGNVGLVELSHRELSMSRIWPPALTVDRRGAAQVQPDEGGGDGFADADAFPSRDGWIMVAEQFPGFLSTWVVPERGNLRGPTERIWMGPMRPVFCEGGLAGLIQGEDPRGTLVLTTIGTEGIMGQHPPQAAFAPAIHVNGSVSAISVERDVWVAAVLSGESWEGPIAILKVNPRAEVVAVDRLETKARGAAWARGGESPWLVWSDADGLFAARFGGDGKHVGAVRLGTWRGAVWAAEIRGKKLFAVVGNQLVWAGLDGSRAKATVALAAPKLEVTGAALAEGYAWFIWRLTQNTPGGQLWLTQIELKGLK